MVSTRKIKETGSAASKKKNGNKPTTLKASKEVPRNLSKGEMKKDTQVNMNSYYDIQSRIRLCFVRIKRDKSIMRLANCDGSGDSNSASTLQSQCEDGAASHADGNISVASNILKSAGNRMNVLNKHNDANKMMKPECNTSNLKSPTPVNHGILKPQAKAGAAFACKKCVVRVKRISMAGQKEFYVRNAAKDALLTSQIINPSLDHKKRDAFRKLSLTLHSISMDNDVNLAKQTFVGCPEGKSTSNSKNTTSKQSSVFKSHIDNTLSTANYLQRRRSMRQEKLAESRKTVQETKELEFLCDKENKAPAGINENRQLLITVQNIKSLRNIQDCKAKELQLKRNLGRRADVISNTYPKRHKEKASQDKNDSQTRSKDKQDMEVAELIKGSTPSCNTRNPVIYLNNLKQYNNNTTAEALNFVPQSNSTIHSQDPKSDFVKRSAQQNRIHLLSAPNARISKQTNESNPFEPLLTATKRNKNTLLSDDGINTPNRPEAHCDNDPLSSLVYNESVITSKQAATIASTKKGVETASILEFHPQRNSTMQFEREQPVSITISNEKSFRKVAGSQEIQDKEVSYSTSHSTKDGNKTNKFFHGRDANTAFAMCKTVTTQMTSKTRKNSRLLPKRSSQVRREQVYDFLSQSQMSDSDGSGSRGKKKKPADPAADIIQKLIAEGKVRVATSARGKGRSVLKRIHMKKPKKVRQNKKMAKKKNNKVQDIQKPPNKPPGILKTIVEQKDDQIAEDDFMDNDDESVFVEHDFNAQKHSSVVRTYKNNNCNTEQQEGTFSNLARSVLLNQAGRSDPQWLNAKRLLDMAKKLISTPKNKNIPPIRTTINVDFSPISSIVPQQTLATNASPWRVDEDAHLPRVFNFSRSSGNLPSFSSDFIPPTPIKEKSNRTNTAKLTEAEVNQAQYEGSPIPEIDGVTPLYHNNVNSSIHSFSSNDSNGENQCPERDKRTNDESADIFNLKHLPNPRRALSYRSPLKPINIMEVVTLPPLDMSKVLGNKKNPQDSSTKKLKSANESEEDLFGFEEFLSQNDISTQEEEPQTTSDSMTTSPVEMIKEKRHLLRKLKLTNADVHTSLQKEVTGEQITTKNEQLFNDRKIVSGKQLTVKEMLCSTMLLETPATNSKAQEVPRNISHRIAEDNNSSGMLFKDIEPDTTFNEEDPHRTYIRPYKRKRRLNENRVIFALESDDSDADGNDLTEKKKPSKNRNQETDTSSEKQPEKRRKKRRRKEKPELIHFVESFNEMCKEVENYELVIEKSV